MNEILRFLKENPLVLVILLAWIAGAVGNVVKAAKKARERAEQAQRQPRELPTERNEQRMEQRAEQPIARPIERPVEPRPAAPSAPRPIRADEIAAEMRRILRGRTEAEARERASTEASAGDVMSETEQPVRRQPSPPPLPAPGAGGVRTRNVVLPERPPVPVVPTTSTRRLQIHVDPHVGEGIARRASVRSGHVGEHALGQLGGRVHGAGTRRAAGHRYALDDLKRIIVLNEILGPPLALRGGTGSAGGRDV